MSRRAKNANDGSRQPPERTSTTWRGGGGGGRSREGKECSGQSGGGDTSLPKNCSREPLLPPPPPSPSPPPPRPLPHLQVAPIAGVIEKPPYVAAPRGVDGYPHRRAARGQDLPDGQQRRAAGGGIVLRHPPPRLLAGHVLAQVPRAGRTEVGLRPADRVGHRVTRRGQPQRAPPTHRQTKVPAGTSSSANALQPLPGSRRSRRRQRMGCWVTELGQRP